MRRNICFNFACAMILVMVGGCSGADVQTINDSTPSTLENKTELATSEACPYGGVKTETGLDLNGNNVLDPEEVTKTESLCNGEPGVCAGNGAPAITSVEIEKGRYFVGHNYTVTVVVTHADVDQTMTYALVGVEATQVGEPVSDGTTTTVHYTFTLGNGGPYALEAIVSDGCQVATLGLAGIKATPPADLLADALALLMGVVDADGDGVVNNYISDLIMLDVATNNAKHSGTNPDWTEIATADVLSTNQIVANLWAQSYRIIDNCNLALQALDCDCCLSKDESNQLQGQALVLRAYAYMTLYRLFGSVPILRTPLDTMNQVRPPLDDVRDFIIADLKSAESLLNASATDNTKIVKWTAKALLSRFYLYLARSGMALNTAYCQEALTKASDVINQGGKQLLPVFGNVFFTNAEAETIWRLDYDAIRQNLLAYYANEAPSGIKEYVFRDDFVSLYGVADTRKSTTVRTSGADLIVNKYPTATSDIPVIRFAEVLLIASESSLCIGNNASAQQYLNQVRVRAGIAPQMSITSDIILEERRRELSVEGEYFYDLQRLGKTAGVMKDLGYSFTVGKDELFPIPLAVMTANLLLAQNPGY